LNRSIISSRVDFLPGMRTPSFARDAISIISRNLGRWAKKRHERRQRKPSKTHLICGHEPFDGSFTERLMRIGDHPLLWRYVPEVVVEGWLGTGSTTGSFF
jgi:hypothetical protein